MTADERFALVVKARMCRACLSNDVVFTLEHMDACNPRNKAKEKEKASFSCTFGRCVNHLWICKYHKPNNSTAIKQAKQEFLNSGIGLAFAHTVSQGIELSKSKEKFTSQTGKNEVVGNKIGFTSSTGNSESVANKGLPEVTKAAEATVPMPKPILKPVEQVGEAANSTSDSDSSVPEIGKGDERGRLRKFFNSAKRQGMEIAPEPKGKPIFMFFAAKGRNKPVNVFMDNGCSDCVVREGIPGVELKGTITKKGPFGMGGVGGLSSYTKDEWMVLVPRADGKMQAVRCYSMNQVTCNFPAYHLAGAVEAVKSDAPENELLQNCKLPSSIGGEVDCLLGIKYNYLHGELIHKIPESGLSIYSSKLMSHDGTSNAMIGGPHESFDFLANVAGGAPALLAYFTEGLVRFRAGAVPIIKSNPICLEEIEFAKRANLEMGEFAGIVDLEQLVGDDDWFEEVGDSKPADVFVNCSCCGEDMILDNKQAMVNSEERIIDMKKWREVMDAGMNIEYRCVKCRSGSDCRNADETERVSLRQEAEDQMIKDSIHIDYKKKQIMATLPLRGKEEDFFTSNRKRALCVLNQNCRKFSGKEEAKKLI